MTYLVNQQAHHIGLCALQPAKGSSEMELDVVALALHTNTQKDMTPRVQWKQDILADQIDIFRRVEL